MVESRQKESTGNENAPRVALVREPWRSVVIVNCIFGVVVVLQISSLLSSVSWPPGGMKLIERQRGRV